MYFWVFLITFASLNIQGNLGSFRARVLGGNYGQYGLDSIPNLRENRDTEKEASNDDDTQQTKTRPKITIQDVKKSYDENNRKVMGKAMNISSSKESEDFKSKITSCEGTLTTCQAIPVFGAKCYIDCLSKGNSKLEPLYHVMKDTLDLMCKPLNTIYMKLLDLQQDEGFPHLKTYPKFLEALGVKSNEFSTIVPQLANALNVIMIQRIQSNMIPLRAPVEVIQKSLNIQQPNLGFLTQNNPGCITLDMWDGIEKLMDIFYKDPSTLDINTPGFTFFTLIPKYLVSKLSRKMAVLMEAVRLFSGSIGGYGCSKISIKRSGSEGGDDNDNDNNRNRDNSDSKNDKANCDDLGRYPLSGFPIPPPLGGPEFASILNPQCSKGPSDIVQGKAKKSMDGGKKDGDKSKKSDESSKKAKDAGDKKADKGTDDAATARKRRKTQKS